MDAFERLQERIHSESSPHGLQAILHELQALETANPPLEALDDIRLNVFHAALRTTLEAPEHARTFIVEQLLPLCLRADSEWPSLPKLNRYRSLLKEWLAELPWHTRQTIRDEAVTHAVSELGRAAIKSACGTIAAIGLRSPAVVVGLWDVVSSHDDAVGDVALATRAGLGVAPSERGELVSELVRRMGSRWNIPLVTAVQSLPDRSVLEALAASWFQPERFHAETEEKGVLVHVTVPLIAAIADAAQGDMDLQRAAWEHLFRLRDLDVGVFRHQVLLGASVSQRINDPAVVQFYLEAFGQEEPRSRFLIYLRLEECIRPRHLLGWRTRPPERSIELLCADACGPTKMQGAFTTEEFQRKNDAWSTLLSLDAPQNLPPWDIAIDGEQNGYAVAEILELAACFNQDPLPRVVPELLAMRFGDPLSEENQRLTAHIAAVHVAHAALTEEAFRAILAFQPISEKGVLISIVDALADVAGALFRAGSGGAIDELWRHIRSESPNHVRSACAGAIARLIRSGVIQAEAAQAACERAEDPGLDIYARRELLESLGHFPRGSLSDDILIAARGLALDGCRNKPAGGVPEDDVMLGEVAIAVLARHGVLASDEELLASACGFHREGGEWKLVSAGVENSIVPYITGILLADFPEQFALATCQIIREAGVRGLYQLAPLLRTARGSLPNQVLNALVERAHLMDAGRTAEPEVLFLLARISPDRLVREPWEGLEVWLPQARAALADALALTGLLTVDLEKSRQGLFTRLIGDGLFGVRRAAYRAVAEVDPHFLANLCAPWAALKGDRTAELRRRAAEGAGWLPDDLLASGVQLLAWDPEPSVRDSWARSAVDRRERSWAAHCLESVLAARSPEDVLAAWTSGRALQKLGDDRTVERLEQQASDPGLPPSVRHWLKRTLKKVRSRWQDVTKKWPEPWFTRRARLEVVHGMVRDPNGAKHQFECCLWLTPGETPTELSSWGGWTVSCDLPIDEIALEVPGRSPATILVLQTSYGSGPTFFVGNGPYPQAQ